MARSNPTMVRADIPETMPPGNRTTVTVKVKQDGPDPWASEDNCTSPNLNIGAWDTPVILKVNGEQVAKKTLCLGPGHSKTADLSLSIPSEGTHTVRAQVKQVGGNAYDFGDTPNTVNDEIVKSVDVQADASDPSEPSEASAFLSRIKDVLPLTGNTFGIPNAVIVLGLATLLFVGVSG